MTTEEQFIDSVKRLQEIKVRLASNIDEALMWFTVFLPDEYNNEKGRESFGSSFRKIDLKQINYDMDETSKLRPFLGNEIYDLFNQQRIFLMRIVVKGRMDFNAGKMDDWKKDKALDYLPERFKKIIKENPVNAIAIIRGTLENEMTDSIEKRMDTFRSKQEINIGGDNINFGSENKKINVKSHNATTTQFGDVINYAKEHKGLTIILLIVELILIALSFKEIVIDHLK
jgi:hypothetical protein